MPRYQFALLDLQRANPCTKTLRLLNRNHHGWRHLQPGHNNLHTHVNWPLVCGGRREWKEIWTYPVHRNFTFCDFYAFSRTRDFFAWLTMGSLCRHCYRRLCRKFSQQQFQRCNDAHWDEGSQKGAWRPDRFTKVRPQIINCLNHNWRFWSWLNFRAYFGIRLVLTSIL